MSEQSQTGLDERSQQSSLRSFVCQVEGQILLFGNNKWAQWALYYGFWTILAILFATEIKSINDYAGNPISWVSAISTAISYLYIWAVLALFVLALGRIVPLEKSFWRRSFPVHTIASLIVPSIHAIIYFGVEKFADWIKTEDGSVLLFREPPDGGPWSAFTTLWVDGFASGIIMYWMILLVGQAIRIYKQYQSKQVELSQMEGQLATARLQALKMQLHPHFLFNTLNSISTLIHKNPNAADRMLSRLSDLLRLTLEDVRNDEVDLRQEIDFLERYLEMEQIRFGDRLSVKFDIDPEILDARIPNLILQPLVENAIQHGIAPNAKQGVIQVKGRRENGMMRISIHDNGKELSEFDLAGIKEGVGLSNTRKRLRQIYRDSYQFDIRNGENGGLIASLEIPFHKIDAPQEQGDEN